MECEQSAIKPGLMTHEGLFLPSTVTKGNKPDGADFVFVCLLWCGSHFPGRTTYRRSQLSHLGEVYPGMRPVLLESLGVLVDLGLVFFVCLVVHTQQNE